ncbi:bifunctional phosphoribosyl-AMP cyclohydrolase/phosphoribosyl-ATP diphosphatase HisIE [Pontibacter akesuensis]|uniref:Histidine biosynthesis bifunctional protein HisIE n=1 Tax=Pontibacter akesuensis TaxID=388950 RepID=A0A1I7G7D1_9BACT|nr:bifunctional phosphoribosyl-AMP cyclohydrolase/phosphoribosyl-ATP diphosphatase HisIE [Pontibacter akesuensis]GHA58373.1 histidine biosynthesis bifunctional protein HisIE [Pontibacter akesuensis]SFU44365.1 phosphoribosyl-ATP pyrophosphatase /phosphoribosyl-AMP cyclohydrolase [Pontibacter akesuensis]
MNTQHSLLITKNKKEVELDFEKAGGLVPAVIQDDITGQVLMLGYMNQEALDKTRLEGLVTFFSRTKNRLWTKGETSGNTLEVVSIMRDCDVDSLLIKVKPNGPTCHTGSTSCFGEEEAATRSAAIRFIAQLEEVIQQRKSDPVEGSYTNFLYDKGINKIAQKVGEEAVETVIDAVAGKLDTMKGEAADLLYHLLVLLSASGLSLKDVVAVLQERHKN